MRSFAMIFILLSWVWTQNTGTIQGMVISADKREPLQEAVALIQETYEGAATNIEGEFVIDKVIPGQYTLGISFIGYESMEIPVQVFKDKTTLVNVELTIKPIHIEELMVTGTRNNLAPQIEIFDTQDNPKDIGEYFRQFNGGSAVKKGGFAMDPVLRSFKYDQLNVQYDGGIRLWGGCPNRMDPPASHIQSEDVKRIEVYKGPFTVRFGQTMGGIVNLVMKNPTCCNTAMIGGSVNTGIESNGEGKRSRVSLFGGKNKLDFYLAGGIKDFGNYSTGSNIEVPSSFNLKDYTVKIGFKPNAHHRIQISWRQSFARNVNYPALPMDAKVDDTDILAFDYSARDLGKTLFLFTAKLFKSDVSHIMNNDSRPNYSAIHAVTDALTGTLGGRIESGLKFAQNQILYLGMDYYMLHKDGDRTREVYKNGCNGMTFEQPKVFTDYVWQNSTLEDMGVFTEYNLPLMEKLHSKFGFRADRIVSEIKNPAPQFTESYGSINTFQSLNTSGLMSFNYTPGYSTMVTLSLARGMRTPNITERYINHLPVGKDPYEYFGNPNLKPETNNQIELAVKKIFKTTKIKTNLYYSRFDNYISAEIDTNMNRLYMPCNDPKYTKRFINITNARQYGLEASISSKLGNGLSLDGNFSYTIGDNLDLNDPLPEAIPLESNLILKYFHPKFNLGAELHGRFVSSQRRISSLYGETETPGFDVYNLNLNFEIRNRWNIRAGVFNLFNRNYYENLSRKYKNMPENYTLYEPGRNFTIQSTYKF